MKFNKKLLVILATFVALMVGSLTLSGCSEDSRPASAQEVGQKQTETAFKSQSAAVPYPVSQLKDSLERRNLKERLIRTNNPALLQYVYLLGDTGTYLGYYAIKGKVSSTQSQMTTDQLVVRNDAYQGAAFNIVNAPGDDGSYGANENGVFFFTTEGVMVTTDMRYIVSDAPLNVTAPKLNVPK